MQMFIWCCCCIDGVPNLPVLENSLFWAITQPVVVIPYRRFGTTYGSWFFTLKDSTDRLSRNVDKNLPILSAKWPRRGQWSPTSRRKSEITHFLVHMWGRGEGCVCVCVWYPVLFVKSLQWYSKSVAVSATLLLYILHGLLHVSALVVDHLQVISHTRNALSAQEVYGQAWRSKAQTFHIKR